MDVLFPTWFLPCAGATPPSASPPLGFCTLDGCVGLTVSSLLVYSWGWVGGVFTTSLDFLPCNCSCSGPAACAAFPAAGYLWVFPVTGCLSFSFPGGVGWASALPFFFWASSAPLACWGSWGFAPCIRVLQLRWCLLGLQVRSPCCPSLTLGLRVSVLLACGVSGVCGLRWRSRLPFVVRHGLGFVDACSGCWLVLVPAVFWTLPWVLPSRFQVGCWLEVDGVSPSLSSLCSFAVEGVDIVLCQVLVGLPSWCCYASGLLGPVVFLLFLLGHLSQVRSVFFLSPRP